MDEPPGAEGRNAEQPLAAGEVRRRATGGALLLAGRSALILALGVVANIVLARLLPPRDFGLVALGAVLVVLSGYLVQGGFGAALIRRPEPPTQRELEAVNGAQLAVTALLVAVFALIGLPFGRDGLVVIAMLASLPLSVVRAPATVLLERQLSYRTIATVDVVEAVAFYAWSITTVALGMGVWGMATGVVVRALAGTIVMLRLGPLGLVRPRWAWAEVRPLLGFGAKLQTISLVGIARDQGLNLGIAAIAGVATLGIWNLAYRVLQAPATIFTTVARISFPALSRLVAAGRDPRPTIERGVATLTVLAGLGTVAVVGFAPALPELVGDEWRGVPATLAWSCVALLVNAPIYVMAVGYLYAVDAPGAVLRSMVAYALTWFAVALPLVAPLGAPAVGIGWIAGSVVNALILAGEARRRSGASLLAPFAVPALAAGLAGGAGWAVATAGERSVLHGALGALCAEAVLLALLALTRRELLRSAYALLKEGVRGGGAAPPEAAPLASAQVRS